MTTENYYYKLNYFLGVDQNNYITKPVYTAGLWEHTPVVATDLSMLKWTVEIFSLWNQYHWELPEARLINTLRLRQNGHHFEDDIFLICNEMFWIWNEN